MVQLPVRNSFTAKDQRKADVATKFIGRGSASSSTEAYRRAFGALANCGAYEARDVVFISAEGARRGRLDPDIDEIERAARARVTFITDGEYDRDRSYNVGERQVALILLSWGYVETAPGYWQPRGAAA